jgi:GAF domain-containing protein
MSFDQSLQAAVSLMEILTLEVEKVRPGDLEGTLRGIALAARDIFEAQDCALVGVDPIGQTYLGPPVSIGGKLSAEEVYTIADKIIGSQQNILLVPDTEAWDEQIVKPARGVGSLALACATTQRRQRPLAVILLSFKEPSQFGDDTVTLLRMFTDRVALILHNAWLLRRYDRVAQIGKQINQSLQSARVLFRELAKNITDILDVSYCFLLAIYNPQSDKLNHFMLYRGEWRELIDMPVEGVCASVLARKESVLINRLSEEIGRLDKPPVSLSDDPEDPESLIFVPLLFRNLPLGVLSVQQLKSEVYTQDDQTVLEMLGHHVALALNTLRLFENLERLNETGQHLVRELNSEELLKNIAHQIREITRADLVNLFRYSKVTQSFIFPPLASGEVLRPDVGPPSFSRPDDIASLTLKKGEPVYARNSNQTLYKKLDGVEPRLGDFEEREGIKSTAALPLRVGDDTVGVLLVNFRQPQTFDAPQKLLIESLGSYAALAIRNSSEFSALTRVIEKRALVGDVAEDSNKVQRLTRRYEKELEVLQKFDPEINQTLGLDRVLRSFLDLTSDYLRGDLHHEAALNAAILIHDPARDELRVRDAIGPNAHERLGQSIPLAKKNGITYWVFNEGRPERLGDVRSDPRYFKVDDTTISEMDIPLVDERDKVFGVISYESDRADAFTQENQSFLSLLAHRAVSAIKNAQRLEQIQRLLDESRATQVVERKILTSRSSHQRVLQVILARALRLTGAEAGQVLLYDRRRDDFYPAVQTGVAPEWKRERQQLDRGLVDQAMRSRRPVVARVGEGAEWARTYEPAVANARWVMAVRMRENRKPRGVIKLESTADGPFTKQDEELLRRLADLAVHALLSTEQFKREQSERKRLVKLHEVDKKITKQLNDPDQVIRLVLEDALELTQAQTGDLHLYENGRLGTTYFTSREGERVLPAEREKDPSVDRINRGIVARVAETRQTYRTEGDAQSDTYYRGKGDIHSEVAVPLVSGGELVGVLNLESRERRAFDSDDEWVLELLAEQAVIAIQKARAYRQAEEDKNRFRWLSRAGEELGEVTDISQLDRAYEVIVGIMGENNEGQAVIRRYEPETGRLVLKAVGRARAIPPFEALPPEDVEWLRGHAQRTIVYKDVHKSEEATAKLSDPATHSLVFTAVEFEDSYYGILALSHEERDYFKEADNLLMEGLARQLAITINRVEEAQARKEAERRASDARIMSHIGRLAFDITHRLGNDLPLVKARADLIRDELARLGSLTPKIDGYVQVILTNVEKSLVLTRNLRNRTGLYNEGKSDRAPMSVPARKLVEEAVRSVGGLSEGVTVTVEADAGVGAVYVEPRDIYNALNNIITNAAQAMPGGGRITVRAADAEAGVRIEVADTGPGIAPEAQAKIFDLFYSTKEGEGRGFGLWSARLDVLSNGGELRVESELGRGATFIITLPRM